MADDRIEEGPCKRNASSPQRGDTDSGSKTDESIAYHEAGHAVVALRLGLPFSSATIVASDEYLGAVMTSASRRRGRRITDLDEKHVMWDIAGPLSERMFTGYDGDFTEPEITRALDLCEGRITIEASLDDGYLDTEKAVQRLGKLIDKTQRILKKDWDLVVIIAQALLAERTLSRQKIRAIVERARKTRARRTRQDFTPE